MAADAFAQDCNTSSVPPSAYLPASGVYCNGICANDASGNIACDLGTNGETVDTAMWAVTDVGVIDFVGWGTDGDGGAFCCELDLSANSCTIHGTELSDTVRLQYTTDDLGFRCTVLGHENADELHGSRLATVSDDLQGQGGGDLIYGYDGDDSLTGDANVDTIYGGDGDDTIDGGDAGDTLYGNDGQDTLFGRNGDDVILGGYGPDTIDGGPDDDTIQGGPSDDVIDGNTGDDTIYGEDGHDTIDGGDGNDKIRGNDGNDAVFGGDGDDIICTGTGDNDHAEGEGDDDLLYDVSGTSDWGSGGAGTDDVAGFESGPGGEASTLTSCPF